MSGLADLHCSGPGEDSVQCTAFTRKTDLPTSSVKLNLTSYKHSCDSSPTSDFDSDSDSGNDQAAREAGSPSCVMVTTSLPSDTVTHSIVLTQIISPLSCPQSSPVTGQRTLNLATIEKLTTQSLCHRPAELACLNFHFSLFLCSIIVSTIPATNTLKHLPDDFLIR